MTERRGFKDYITGIQNAINYIEMHLTDEIETERLQARLLCQHFIFKEFSVFCVVFECKGAMPDAMQNLWHKITAEFFFDIITCAYIRNGYRGIYCRKYG